MRGTDTLAPSKREGGYHVGRDKRERLYVPVEQVKEAVWAEIRKTQLLRHAFGLLAVTTAQIVHRVKSKNARFSPQTMIPPIRRYKVVTI